MPTLHSTATRSPRLALAAAGLVAVAGLAVPASAAASTTTHHSRHASSADLPKVTGKFGVKPTLRFTSATPPKTLVTKVLHAGTGPVVKKGDLLVCNYYGQIWKGKVFDTSFGRGLFGTPIGVNRLIPGWDKGLVGQRVGSRVLLSIPPADGYGPKGNSAAGITGTSTLEFVIDIVGIYNASVHGDAHAKVLHREVNGIKIGGKVGGRPTVTVTKSAPQPKSVSVTLLDRGHGPKITPGLVVDQYVVGTWNGVKETSTWSLGTPDSQPVGNSAQPDLLDKTIGMPLGSRVLIEIPKSSSGGPYALVVDLVAQPHEPK